MISLYYICFSFFGLNKNKKCLNLGLDLKGGISLILDISEKDLLQKFFENSKNPFFIEALSYADKNKKNNQNGDYLSFFINFLNRSKLNNSFKYYSDLFENENNIEEINSNFSSKELETFLRKKRESSIVSIKNILRSRMNQFGISQPNIQRIKNSNRISIEFSKIENIDRIKNILEKKAELRFFETYNLQEIFPYLKNMDILFQKNSEKSFIDLLNISKLQSINTNAIGLIHKKHKKMISEFLNSMEYKSTKIFQYNFLNVKFLWGKKNVINDDFFQLFAVKSDEKNMYSSLNGDIVNHVYKSFGPFNEIFVNIKMNREGTKKWKIFTEKNVGKNIAIVLDNLVYATPLVQSIIPNGISQISGNFSSKESDDLINVLNTGELPTSVSIIQSEIIGPSLGKDSIKKGVKSFLISLFFVFFWMIFYYSIPGLYSDIILIFNVIFIFGILISINSVLTFPGIAGIILTLAMSMDSNILIYEKIKENIKNKVSIFESVKDSYSFNGAFSSIIDGQITTFLCGIILLYFGTGPIKGFSITLIIGIIISIFTSTCLGKLFIEWHLKKYQKITFNKRIFVNFLDKIQNIKWNFLSKRKWAYIVSSILLISSIFSLIYQGLNLGLDFVGGRSYIIVFEKKMVPEKVSSILSNTFLENGIPSIPNVRAFGNQNKLKIITKYKIWEKNDKIDEEILKKIFSSLKNYFPTNFRFEDFKNIKKNKFLGVLSSEKVEPIIAEDMKEKSFLSITISIITIFLYIFLRFKKWQFGLGAVISLIHDSIIVLGFYSFFYKKFPILEIDQSFIAALLTIIGYSINDTVIIYDQIRKIYNKKALFSTMRNTINTGIINSLSRTINTSLITLLVISIIFLFGGTTLKSFMLSLFIGISIGTYSSLFIAPSIVYDFCKKK